METPGWTTEMMTIVAIMFLFFDFFAEPLV